MSTLLNKVIILSTLICILTARDTALSYVPVVMLGYDVVAYHLNVTGCDSILGKQHYSYQLSSADSQGILRLYEFWFADENNLNIFKSDPFRWAPRFGGFCSFGTCCERAPTFSWNATFQGPPSGPDRENCGFRIHDDGYLYFNVFHEYDDIYFSNAAENIESSKDRWIEWYGSLNAGAFNHHCFSTAGHNTVDDCVEYGQRHAAALHSEEEIYPVDYDYYDGWFDTFTDVTTPGDETKCTAICKQCPDGSCQPTDDNCVFLGCPASSYLLLGVMGIGALLCIVVAIAFVCIRKKNEYLTENFDQLVDHDQRANVNQQVTGDTEDIEDIEADIHNKDTVREAILPPSTPSEETVSQISAISP